MGSRRLGRGHTRRQYLHGPVAKAGSKNITDGAMRIVATPRRSQRRKRGCKQFAPTTGNITFSFLSPASLHYIVSACRISSACTCPIGSQRPCDVAVMAAPLRQRMSALPSVKDWGTQTSKNWPPKSVKKVTAGIVGALRGKAANLTGRYSSRYKGRHVEYSLVALCST